jgi:hypothetical protein
VPTWYSACGVMTPVSVASTNTAHDGPAANESPPTQSRSGAVAVGVSVGVVPLPAFDLAVVVVGVAGVDVDGDDDDDVSLVGVLIAASSDDCSRLPLLLIDSVVALESTIATSAASTATSRTAITSAIHGRGAREGGRRCTAHTLPSTVSASADSFSVSTVVKSPTFCHRIE